MNKIENERELLNLFVGKDDPLHPWVERPFIDESGELVFATNRYILIAINKECCTANDYISENVDIKKRIMQTNCSHDVDVSHLDSLIRSIPQESETISKYINKTCPECDGSGEVTVEYYAKHDDEYYNVTAECPICRGDGSIFVFEEQPTGKMIPKKDSAIDINWILFPANYIQILINACNMLSVKTIKIVNLSKNDWCIFELDSGIRVVLQQIPNDEDIHVVKLEL